MIIAHLTDLHMRPRGLPAYRVVETNMFAERAFRAVAALRPAPDAVVISGDLVDCGLPEEYEMLLRLIRSHLTMPVYVIPGNHDKREPMKSVLRHLPGVADDDRFIQYTVEDLPVRLVMLDSVVPGAGHGELCADRLAFLEEALARDPEKPTAVFVHHPPIKTGIGHMDAINLHDADGFAAIIARNPQVERIFCGHYHRSIVARFGGSVVQVIPGVAHQVSFDLNDDAPGSFVMEPPAFAVHCWSPDAGLVSHEVKVDAYPGPYPFAFDHTYPEGFGTW